MRRDDLPAPRGPRRSRAFVVLALAPVAPPCFSARSQWQSYLTSAAEEQRGLHAIGASPLVFHKTRPPTFNREFSFCTDCLAGHAQAMQRAGRCKPQYLLELLPADADVERQVAHS